MNGSISNTELGDILELLALKALAKITGRKLGPGTRPAEVAPHREVIEWNLPNPQADRYGTPFTNYRLIWHQANRQQGKSGISHPDLTFEKNSETRYIIEAKNLKPAWTMNWQWALERVISRFESYPAPLNILLISKVNLLPQDSQKITQTFREHNITTVEVGRQITSLHDTQASQAILELLHPLINRILEKLKNRQESPSV